MSVRDQQCIYQKRSSSPWKSSYPRYPRQGNVSTSGRGHLEKGDVFPYLSKNSSIYGAIWLAYCVYTTCVHSPWILLDALEGECPHCANRGTVACKAESLPRDHKTERWRQPWTGLLHSVIRAASLMRLGKYTAGLPPSPTPVLLADIITQSRLPFPLSLCSALPSSARQPP